LLAKLNQECMAFYEEHCNDKDSVGLVALSDSVDSNLIVKCGPKEEEGLKQREGINKATREVAENTSYPALPTAVDMVVDAVSSTVSDVFLLYISDGSTWDARSFSVMQDKIQGAKKRRTISIDVIAIGLEVEDQAFAENCRDLCLSTRSRHSKYLSASRDSIDDAFESAASLITASTSSEGNRVKLGMTMEKF
jgi:hypothetical protein